MNKKQKRNKITKLVDLSDWLMVDSKTCTSKQITWIVDVAEYLTNDNSESEGFLSRDLNEINLNHLLRFDSICSQLLADKSLTDKQHEKIQILKNKLIQKLSLGMSIDIHNLVGYSEFLSKNFTALSANENATRR